MNEIFADDKQTHELWLEHGSAKLFAQINGSGQPLIFLHGALGDHRASMLVVAPLFAELSVITPDLRASGKSVDTGPLTWDLLADDVAALMRHLRIDRAIVGGVSSGCGAALRFALRYPEKTRGLVIVQPVHGGAARGLEADQTEAFRNMDQLGKRALDEGIEALYPLYHGLPPEIRQAALAMVADFDPASVAATTGFLASGAQPFAAPADLQALACPTLLLPGSDALHPAEVSDLYAEHIPGCIVSEASSQDRAAAIGEFCKSVIGR